MRPVLLAALVLVLPAQADARHAKASPPRPISSPTTWVLSEDYPAAALRQHVEGSVGFSVIVSTEGMPISCKVTRSSGNQELDDAACARIVERGEFQPARDKKGRATQGIWSNTVRWQIPKLSPVPPPGYLIASFVVEKDGSVSGCQVEEAQGEIKIPEGETCPSVVAFEPIVDEQGNPVRKRIRMMMRVTHEDVPQ